MGRCPCFGSRKKSKEKNLNDREEEEKKLKSVASTVSGRSSGFLITFDSFALFFLF